MFEVLPKEFSEKVILEQNNAPWNLQRIRLSKSLKIVDTKIVFDCEIISQNRYIGLVLTDIMAGLRL